MRNSLVVFSILHFVLFVFHVLYTHNSRTEFITQPSRLTHKIIVGHDGEKDILLNDQLSKMVRQIQENKNKIRLTDNYDEIVKDCRTYNRVIKGTKALLRVTFDSAGNYCVFSQLKSKEEKRVNYKDVRKFLDSVNLKRLGK